MFKLSPLLLAITLFAATAVGAAGQDDDDIPLPDISPAVDRMLWCGSAIAVMGDPGNGVPPVPELAERGTAMVGVARNLMAAEGLTEPEIELLVTLYAEDAQAIVLGSGAMRYSFEQCVTP